MNTLKAEKRSMDVKAKKLRREGFVTGNLFGKEIEGFCSAEDEQDGSGTSAENRAQRKPDHAECGRTGLRCSDQRGRL